MWNLKLVLCLRGGLGKSFNLYIKSRKGEVLNEYHIKEEAVGHLLVPYLRTMILWELLFVLFWLL